MPLTFMSLMDRGGPLMWVIFATACVAMVMLVERAIALFRQIRQARCVYVKLLENNIDSVAFIRRNGQSPVSRLLNDLDWKRITSKEVLVKEVNVQLAGAMARLEGSLPTIATLGALLPMLGLLGTVTGMINVFDVIAVHGSGEADAMAQGISQALLTTASGLAIAIPVIFFHHLLVRRLSLLMTITEQSLHVLLNKNIDDLLPRMLAETKEKEGVS